MKKRVGFIGIITEDRKRTSAMINKILADYGDDIVGRLGVPYRERNCSVITLIVDTSADVLGSLTGKLGSIKGVTVKSAFMKAV